MRRLHRSHYLYVLFDELNDEHFRGRLPRPEIARSTSEMPIPTANDPDRGIRVIGLAESDIDTELSTTRDAMLHQIIHYALAMEGNADREHGVRFVDLANRIGAALGIPPVLPATAAAQAWPKIWRKAQLAAKKTMR